MKEHWLTRALATGFMFGRIAEMTSRDLLASNKVPLRDRVTLWRHGFIAPSGAIYGTERAVNGDYLSDTAMFLRTGRINERFSHILDNKLAFTSVMDDLRPGLLPELLGTVLRGEISLRDGQRCVDASATLTKILDESDGVVVKPVEGSSGRGLFFVDRDEGGEWLLNGARCSEGTVLAEFRDRRADVITERITQAAYAQTIQPASTNTIRILTLRNPDGEVLVPAAAHRFGASAAGFLDAWHQGGMSAGIDLATGRMGQAAALPTGPAVEWHSHHPDTGELIEDVVIPGWSDMLGELVEIARQLPYLPYIGWDIVITDDGFRILEGNNRTEIDLLQVHGPLLKDPRVREFFRTHGCRVPPEPRA